MRRPFASAAAIGPQPGRPLARSAAPPRFPSVERRVQGRHVGDQRCQDEMGSTTQRHVSSSLACSRQAASTGLARHADAQAFKRELEANTHRGRAVDPQHGRQTLGDWSEAWQASRTNLRASTAAKNLALFRTHIAPAWSHVALQDITQPNVQAWVNRLNGPIWLNRPSTASTVSLRVVFCGCECPDHS